MTKKKNKNKNELQKLKKMNKKNYWEKLAEISLNWSRLLKSLKATIKKIYREI